MADLWVLVPSRGRPKNVARLVQACAETCTADTCLSFAFDDDDPDRDAGIAATGGHRYTVGPRDTLAGWTNDLARRRKDDAPYLASIGDDMVPKTHGWDTLLITEIERAHRGIGLAYPNDGIRNDIPEAVVMSSIIVKALGWMALPACKHFYIDDCWRDLGAGARCLSYCGDVIVEHRHHIKGAPMDQTYADANPLIPVDAAAYRTWRLRHMHKDIAKIRALREVTV